MGCTMSLHLPFLSFLLGIETKVLVSLWMILRSWTAKPLSRTMETPEIENLNSGKKTSTENDPEKTFPKVQSGSGNSDRMALAFEKFWGQNGHGFQ